MGLDMYLERCKKRDSATAREVLLVDKWIDWLERDDEYRDCPPCEWNGLKDEDISDRLKELAEKYKSDRCDRGGTIIFTWHSVWREVGYWRKANQIHRYFVETVQHGEDNCGIYEVPKEVLEDLLERCKIIEEFRKSGKEKDLKLVSYILPTTEGFFFGSTDYDEYYFADIALTIEILTRVLEETDFDNEMICYSSSW